MNQLLLKHKKTPKEIESVDYHVNEISDDIGMSMGWGMWGSMIPYFIKRTVCANYSIDYDICESNESKHWGGYKCKALYLSILKHKIPFDRIEGVDYDVYDIKNDIGWSIDWPMWRHTIPNFIKKWRTDG